MTGSTIRKSGPNAPPPPAYTVWPVAGAGRNGVGVPPGGATAQALVKASGADYDTLWSTVAVFNPAAVAITGGTITGLTSLGVGAIADVETALAALDARALLDATPDFYVSTTGDDADDGTAGAPWASLSKIADIDLTGAGRVVVLVTAGTYDKATDFIQVDAAAAGGAPAAGAVLTILFEPGCIMDGTAANASGAQAGIEFGGAAWTARVIGNGLVVRDYFNAGDAAGTNGCSLRGKTIGMFEGITVTGSADGFTAHDEARMVLSGVTAQGNTKGALLNVDDSVIEASRSVFHGGGTSQLDLAGPGSNARIELVDCILVPGTSEDRMRAYGATLTRCRIGTTSARVDLISDDGRTARLTDCYVNAYIDGSMRVDMDRCYGQATFRVRSGGAIDCRDGVFSGPATGRDHVIWGNTATIGAGSMTFARNVFETATASAFSTAAADVAALMAAADIVFEGNILSGSAAFDADIVDADDGTMLIGNVTGDGHIGAADTTDPRDYGYGASGSGSAGFAIGAVVPPQVFDGTIRPTVRIADVVGLADALDGRATAAQGAAADSALQSVADDATPQLGGDLDGQGNVIEGHAVKIVTGVSGALTMADHSGNHLVTSGNVTVPTTAGFNATIRAGGAHTVTFDGSVYATMADGDLFTLVVEDATTMQAVHVLAADKASPA